MAKDTNHDIIDLDLSPIRRKRIRLDGDDNRILELNTSDINAVVRLKEVDTRLEALAEKLSYFENLEIGDDLDGNTIDSLSDKIKEIDTEMRDIIDYIFNSNVSELMCDGSMFDPIDDKLRYEYIIELLLPLYTDAIEADKEHTNNRVKSHTAKYTDK